MIVYSNDMKRKALELAREKGVAEASRELNIAEQTIYRWRSRETLGKESGKPDDEDEKQNEEDSTRKLCIDTDREIAELRKQNQDCQKTIAYLVEENTALRQQCEKYLMAISLISQR